MTRTTVDVDDLAPAAARRELGSKGLSEKINAALRDAARPLSANPELTERPKRRHFSAEFKLRILKQGRPS